MAIRTVCGAKRFDRSEPLFDRLQVFTFDQLYLFCSLNYLNLHADSFKIKNNSRFTRSSNRLMLENPNVTKSTSRNQFCFKSVMAYNKYSKLIDLTQKNSRFKKILKLKIMNNQIKLLDV